MGATLTGKGGHLVGGALLTFDFKMIYVSA